MLSFRRCVHAGSIIVAGVGVSMSAPAHAVEVSSSLLTTVATAATAHDLMIDATGTVLEAVSSAGVMTTYVITGREPVESASIGVGPNLTNAYFTAGPDAGRVYVYGQQPAPKSGYNNFLFDIDRASNSILSATFMGGGSELSSPAAPANLPTTSASLGQPTTGVVVADLTGRYILVATDSDEMLVVETATSKVVGAVRAGNGNHGFISRALDSSNRLYVASAAQQISVINLALLGSLPPAPQQVSARVASATSAAVTWTAPESGSPVTAGNAVLEYLVTASPGNRTCTTAGLTCTVRNLTRGQKYTFSVQSQNTMARSMRVSTARPLALQKPTRCSRGGPCAIGEIGPGGGIVFAVPSTKGNSSRKTYEAAPNSWSGGSADPALPWSQALTAAAAYRGGSTTGWRLPSITELGWLYRQRAVVGGFEPTRYWSATARNESYADNVFFNTGRRGEYDRDSAFLARPIRRF